MQWLCAQIDYGWVAGALIASVLIAYRSLFNHVRAVADELDSLGLKEYVRVHTAKLERDRIQRVLEAEEGNVTRAARRLGISRKSLQTKMKEYGLRDE